MPFSDLFHPEYSPVEPQDAPHYVVFSCVQWKTSSLEVMPQAAKQSFAVMYGDPSNPLNPYTSAALERAYILGAMSAVRLIAVNEDSLYLFLESGVSTATFQKVESLWTKVISMGPIRLTVNFANVTEVYSGHSDYVFWQDAKEILESYGLGIAPYDLKALDDFSGEGFIDEDLWFLPSQEDGQHEAIQHCPAQIPNFADMTGHSKCRVSPHYIFPDNRNPDA